MKSTRLAIAALAVAAIIITLLVLRVLEQNKEMEAGKQIQSATTNMMREMKPLTAPPIFPEKN
jgi:uncharacterized membrane protein